MTLALIAILIFGLGYVLATIFRSKTDAIINEFERLTKHCITPDFYKYQALTFISVVLSSIAIGVLIMLIV